MPEPGTATSAEPASYADLVRELFPRLTGGIRWGLERTERMLASVGDPQLSYPVIHVGGTNGKGSVAAMAASTLRAAGLRTGLYTSPHLTSFRERVRVDGAPVSESALLDAARAVWPSVREQQPSFFEATTALAFRALADAAVEVAVVEVGLGGRLDSTNVVRPDVAVVTQVTREHAALLGDDIETIAGEKVGIAKEGVPLLTAERDPSVLRVLERGAAERGARLVGLGDDAVRDVAVDAEGTAFTTDVGGEPARLRTPLPGAHQAVNAALALRAIELSRFAPRLTADVARGGLAATRWPGRFQRERLRGGDWVLDVAHNPAAMRTLVASLEAVAPPRPWTFVVAILGDKEWPPMLETLAAAADRLILTRPEHAPAERAWDPDAVRAATGVEAEVIVPLPRALDAADARGGTVVVTGSFHTVGEAMTHLGIDPGWTGDPFVPQH